MHAGASPKVFQNAAKLRLKMTKTEQMLWEYLRKKPEGFKFRRQHPIAGYVLDFYCHRLRLSIEIDGGYHLSVDQKLKDQKRTTHLNELGITEIRFTNKQVTNEPKSVLEKINSILKVD